MTEQSNPHDFKVRRDALRVLLYVGGLGSAPAALNFVIANKESLNSINAEQNNLSFWVNSKHLSSELDALIYQVKNNPGRFDYSYAYVAPDCTHQIASEKLLQSLGLSLTAVPFKNWTHAIDALTKGRVDAVFAPAALISNYFRGHLPTHVLPVLGR